MSYDMITSIWVLNVPMLRHNATLHIGFAEIACNNITSNDTGLPVKEIFAAHVGVDYSFMTDVVKTAAACESGELRLGNEERTLPERYIAMWRKKKAEAVTIEQYLEEADRLYLEIPDTKRILEERMVKGYDAKKLLRIMDRINTTEGFDFTEETFLGEQTKQLAVLLTPDNLDLFRDIAEEISDAGELTIRRSNFSPRIFEDCRIRERA